MIRSQETIIEKHHVVFLYHTKKGLLADNPVYFRPKLYKYPLQLHRFVTFFYPLRNTRWRSLQKMLCPCSLALSHHVSLS